MTKKEFVMIIENLIEDYRNSPEYEPPTNQEGFGIYWHFVGWWALSLGLHVGLQRGHKNVEVHLPFGFFRIGNERYTRYEVSIQV